jgi:hypothetical protein
MKKHKSSKAMLRKARRNYRAMQSKTAHLVQLSWQSPLAKPTIAIHEAREAHSAPAIFIYKSEFDYLSRCILDYLSEETGGQLYGFYTEKGEYVIVYAIGPGPQANHQITFFNQDKEYLLKVNHVMLKHGLQKIGEWHSHHQLGLNRPSGHDVNSVVSVMRKYQINSHLLCIGNIDHKGRSTENAFTFSKDNDYCTQHAAWKVIDMDSPYRPLIDNDPELAGVLRHPRTQNARHGQNFLVEDNVAKPDFQDGYWLKNKENRLVLKQIVDYLTDLGYTCSVNLDSNGIVHLVVQRSGEGMEIVFGKNFPHEAPLISFPDGSDMIPEWEYNGSIYDSFVRCYNKFAFAINNYNNMYNF